MTQCYPTAAEASIVDEPLDGFPADSEGAFASSVLARQPRFELGVNIAAHGIRPASGNESTPRMFFFGNSKSFGT
jgi:hypothetical protein